MPPSTSTSIRPSTASATSGSASMVADRAVELAAAVVRDDHARGAVLDRQRRVLRRQDALHQHRQVAVGDELLEVVPADGRVHQGEHVGRRARRSPCRRRSRSSARSPRPGSRTRCAGRARGGPSRGTSTVSASASKPASSACSISARVTPAVAEYVELEPAAPLRARRPRSPPGVDGGERRQHHHGAGAPRRRAPSPGSPSGWAMRWNATGRDQQRHRHLRAEHGRRRRRRRSRPPARAGAAASGGTRRRCRAASARRRSRPRSTRTRRGRAAPWRSARSRRRCMARRGSPSTAAARAACRPPRPGT